MDIKAGSVTDYKMKVIQSYVNTADALTPPLFYTQKFAKSIVRIGMGKSDYEVLQQQPIEALQNCLLGIGDHVVIDFGEHVVGNFSCTLLPVGLPPDAPALFRVKFGETPFEIAEDAAAYHGTMSGSWIQEERLHADFLPETVLLTRRYAYRYVEIHILDIPQKYKVRLQNIFCTAQTSADFALVPPLRCKDAQLQKIDAVGLKTLAECMQEVFEDGPKRDRRLWIADFYLQAKLNYCSFQNLALVKKCLYLFAGLLLEDGRVASCIYSRPQYFIGETDLFDYSLCFISTLLDYQDATEDTATVAALWPTCMQQVRLAMRRVDAQGLVRDSDDWWCFIDWNDALNKQAPAQAVLIFSIRQAQKLAVQYGSEDECAYLAKALHKVTEAALAHLWDSRQKMFVSGAQRQISWASQVWFVLADILTADENKALLQRTFSVNPEIRMVTPYMYHYVIEALLQVGEKEHALQAIRAYWGGMIADGADCFWELYDPLDKKGSPYGSRIINSFCHAWSCTGSYFMRKYFQDAL